MDAVIRVESLRKTYGDVLAVDDLGFEVRRREVFGLLGPNGAGKTTTVEIVEGLRTPDSGRVTVLGLDAGRSDRQIKERIGVQLQFSEMYDKIRVNEVIRLFRSYYSGGLSEDEVLDLIHLGESRARFVNDLSGGQKQRLALGLAMVNDPEILILDEPTTGLDPQARRNTWELIERLRESGKTVLLTTHYMEEAERLCDRVLIVDRGRRIALDSPEALVEGLDADRRVEFRAQGEVAEDLLRSLPGVNRYSREGDRFVLFARNTGRLISELLETRSREGWVLEDLHIRRATLEDVFIELTGRRLRE
jgi:ABC-2 type transport system ATP-binding protein